MSRRRKFLGGGESIALRSTFFTYFFFEKKIIKFSLDSSPCVFLRDECLSIGRARTVVEREKVASRLVVGT